MKVCLVGNPNCGKTTLFNALTGLNQKVGNYSGVTVDKFSGSFKSQGQTIELVDLPGTYSLYPNSEDEVVVYNVLVNDVSQQPDVVVLVLNASQIRRSLILATQVMQLEIPCVIAINMVDEVNEHDCLLYKKKIEHYFSVPVCLISATQQKGLSSLKQKLHESKQVTLPYEPAWQELHHQLSDTFEREATYKDYVTYCLSNQILLPKQKQKSISSIQQNHRYSTTKAMSMDIRERYKIINELLKQTIESKPNPKLTQTQNIDRILTHKVFGLPIALVVMYLLFQAIFSFSSYPMDFVEQLFVWMSNIAQASIPEGWIQDLIINGILAGLSGVLVFIPQIAVLFGLLAILEGTGYLARISFMLDRLMRKFGLSGRAVLPMMSGFACAIPAVMATRTISSWKERLISIMVIPLLSCSARLPVYILLIGMFIPEEKVFLFIGLQGLTMMAFYIAGLLLALLIAGILQRILGASDQQYFIMELPTYRFPQWRNVLLTMYQKAKIFAVEAGKVIFVISIVLWILATFGPANEMSLVHQEFTQLEQTNNGLTPEQEKLYSQELLLHSFAGKIGKTIEPVIQPLGYDWKIGIALLTSFAAREVFVGTMATIYSVEYNEDNPTPLQERLKSEKDPETGKPIYSVATIVSLLIFFAFAMQCMSTLAIVYRETKSWKWPFIQLLYMTVLAYALSFAAFQLLH